jgi:LysM repeat protein
MIGPMGRMSFVVSALLACAFAAVVLAAALLVNLFPSGPGGVAVATTRPPGTFTPQTTTPTAAPTSTPVPTPSSAPMFDPNVGGTYTVRPGDFLSAIGERVGVPWQLIAQANGIQGPDYVIVPGQVLIIPAIPEPTAGAEFHIVQAGDTITRIAQEYGVDPTDLADFNNIADWNSIRVGDQLFIPGPGWTPRPEASF